MKILAFALAIAAWPSVCSAQAADTSKKSVEQRLTADSCRDVCGRGGREKLQPPESELYLKCFLGSLCRNGIGQPPYIANQPPLSRFRVDG